MLEDSNPDPNNSPDRTHERTQAGNGSGREEQK